MMGEEFLVSNNLSISCYWCSLVFICFGIQVYSMLKPLKCFVDYQPMLDALDLLLRTLILPTGILIEEDNLLQVLDKVLQLMLCILSGLHNHNDMSTISACSLQWAPVFGLKNSR